MGRGYADGMRVRRPATLPHFERDPVLMTPTRTTARGLFLTFVILLLGAGAAAASAATPTPTLIFPVLGEVRYQDDFGDARGQGGHQGNDLMAPRMALALAAEAGTVKFWTTSSRAGCMLYLYGASGTTYLYVHLNNDLTNANDNQGTCVPGVAYAKGLKSGAKVAAGQPIAYVGDSGDADGIHPHLHFEVHPDDGAAVNPFPYLRKARRLVFAAQPGSTFTLALTGKVVSAAGEDLALTLDQVRSWPGGRKIKHAGQKVAVAVPETASVEGIADPSGLSPFPTLELLTKGVPVTVWTAPAKVTFAALVAAKGALAAARVVVKP
jgi:peptidoglycan LD-endopeptidase LytH